MSNLKRFEDFMKESTDNKGKGVGGDTDFFSRPTPKQTINKGSLDPIGNVGIMGHQITTDKIDGLVKSVKDGIVYVEERETKEIKEFPIAEFLKEFNKYYKKLKKDSEFKVEESIKLDDHDKELLSKIIYGDKINEAKQGEKELWEKKWENFATNIVKSTKLDLDEDELNEDQLIEVKDTVTENVKKKKFIVIDNDFNNSQYEDLVGRIFDEDNIPSYAQVKEVKDEIKEKLKTLTENATMDELFSVNEGSTPYSETKWGEKISQDIYDDLKENGFSAEESQDIIDSYFDFEQMIYDIHDGMKIDQAVEMLINNYKKPKPEIVSNNYSNRHGIMDDERVQPSVDSHGNFVGMDEKVKIERFSDFSKRLRVRPDVIDEDLQWIDELDENFVPKSLPKVECSDCGVQVEDNRNDKIGHLYSKHNFKPTVDEEDINTWLLEYFPPNVEEEKKKK